MGLAETRPGTPAAPGSAAAGAAPPAPNPGGVIVLYDGVCGLCSRIVSFLLPRDRHRRIRFAALQGQVAATILGRHGVAPVEGDPQSIVLVEFPDTPSERLYFRSSAALRILRTLPGVWPVLAALLVLPRFVRDWGYDRVANNRYRIFGRLDACTLPSPENRSRFLD
jgi:predicted DCC family thiol-disulfide oxidoreductase YuxK